MEEKPCICGTQPEIEDAQGRNPNCEAGMSIDWTRLYGDSLPRPEYVETDRAKWGPDPVTGDGIFTQADWDEVLAQFPDAERPEAVPQEVWDGLCAASKWHTANCPPFEEMTLEVEEL